MFQPDLLSQSRKFSYYQGFYTIFHKIYFIFLKFLVKIYYIFIFLLIIYLYFIHYAFHFHSHISKLLTKTKINSNSNCFIHTHLSDYQKIQQLNEFFQHHFYLVKINYTRYAFEVIL